MTMRREIRVAQVEYQPNLHHPVQPIPLGVVVEELRGSTRQFVIFGRQPRGDVPGLQLENTWGPFRNVVTGWGELMLKNVRELLGPTDTHGPFLDKLAQQWNLNVYLRQPQVKVVRSSTAELRMFAERWFAQYANSQPSRLRRPKKKKKFARKPARRQSTSSRNRLSRWLSISNQMQAHE
jgi:hypothetical protein